MTIRIISVKLHSTVKNFSPRGGAAVQETQGVLFVVGGADREQQHYQDCCAYISSQSAAFFESVKTDGDVPTERCGHSTAAYGKYVFLFGGIDFSEESVFNDLYLLDTESRVWSYVGESGREISARNSHSLAIVKDGNINYIVMFGGASPEYGTFRDTYIAELPDAESIDPKSFFVCWQKLNSNEGGPESREMHSTCSFNGRMFISGGRNANGQVLSDVWMLTCRSNIEVRDEIVGLVDVSTHSSSNAVGSNAPSAILLPPPPNPPTNNNEKKTEALIYELTSSNCPEDISGTRIQVNPINCDYAPSEGIIAPLNNEEIGTLSPPPASTNTTSVDISLSKATVTRSAFPLQWQRCLEMELDAPRCAHGSAILARAAVSDLTALTNQLPAPTEYYMVLFGGFSGEGVSADFSLCKLPPSPPPYLVVPNHLTSPSVTSLPPNVWSHPSCPNSPKGRFGLAMCSVSAKLVRSLQQNKRYGPVFHPSARQCAESWAFEPSSSPSSAEVMAQQHAGAVIFGGVSAEQDFGDLWLLMLS